MNLRRFMPAPTRSGDRILTAQLIAWLGHRDIGQCLRWVKSCPDRLEMGLLLYLEKQTQFGHPDEGIATAILTIRRPRPPPDR